MLNPDQTIHGASPLRSPQLLAAWAFSAAALIGALVFHLLPALLGGLLVYEVVKSLSPYLHTTAAEAGRARVIVVAGIAATVVITLSIGVLLAIQFFTSDAGRITDLMQRLASIIDGSRERLPDFVAHYLPETAEELRLTVTEWLRKNAHALQVAGADGARIIVHVLLGMVIGAMVALHRVTEGSDPRPLAVALSQRVSLLSTSFRRVVFAQVRIAALNAAFTGAYLLLILPLFGVHLPLRTTMIIVTLLLGLLPVVGNLASNVIIVIVSLSHSPGVAVASLVFLVVIHKLEYFLNARIIGSSIRAHSWELLIAILAMEAVFGIPGVVAAPIFYAYLKEELGLQKQV